MEIKFFDEKHHGFYNDKMTKLTNDCYYRPFIYLVGLTDVTRKNFDNIYNKDGINPNCLSDGWQTGTSRKICRLAFNLFNGCYGDDGSQLNVENYVIDNIFCCEFAPFFVEALKLRFPEYFSN